MRRDIVLVKWGALLCGHNKSLKGKISNQVLHWCPASFSKKSSSQSGTNYIYLLSLSEDRTCNPSGASRVFLGVSSQLEMPRTLPKGDIASAGSSWQGEGANPFNRALYSPSPPPLEGNLFQLLIFGIFYCFGQEKMSDWVKVAMSHKSGPGDLSFPIQKDFLL